MEHYRQPHSIHEYDEENEALREVLIERQHKREKEEARQRNRLRRLRKGIQFQEVEEEYTEEEVVNHKADILIT